MSSPLIPAPPEPPKPTPTGREVFERGGKMCIKLAPVKLGDSEEYIDNDMKAANAAPPAEVSLAHIAHSLQRIADVIDRVMGVFGGGS